MRVRNTLWSSHKDDHEVFQRLETRFDDANSWASLVAPVNRWLAEVSNIVNEHEDWLNSLVSQGIPPC